MTFAGHGLSTRGPSSCRAPDNDNEPEPPVMTTQIPRKPVTFHHPSLNQAQSISILAGAAIMLSLAMGMRQSLGLFMQPITKDIGISAADFAFALAIQNIVWGVAQPFAGALVDRYGTRLIEIGRAHV